MTYAQHLFIFVARVHLNLTARSIAFQILPWYEYSALVNLRVLLPRLAVRHESGRSEGKGSYLPDI